MAERIRGLQIDIGLNNMGIDRKLSEIKRSFRGLSSDLKLSRNNFINSEKSMTSYKNRVRELDGALNVSKKNLKALKAQYELVSKEQGHNSKSAQQLRQEISKQADTQNYLQKELGQTAQEFKDFQKEAREAQRVASSGWGKVGKTFESMGPKLTNAGDAMKGVGRNMSMYVTAPIVGGFGLAVKTAADFEGQMSRVGAIAESSKGELKAMSDQAVDLGAKTSKSAGEVAQGMEELASLGFNAQEIMKAMPSVISASEASGADMAETATIMASSLNAFGLEAKDSGHVADLLAMAANKSAADISYMGDALKYAGPPAKSLGVSLEDTSAAIGIMSDSGLEGGQAGTALRASFIRLAKPTKASAKAMEEMGISLSDSKGNFVGMPALIKQFQDGMKGMTKEQKLANVAQIVGTESASGFLTLIDAGPSKIDKFSKSLKNSDGASKKAADRMKDNLKGSLEQLGGAFESAGIIIGNLFAPILRKLADTITWLVEKLNGMSKGMQITMVVLATLSAAIGPLVFVFGAFISVLGSAMTYLAPFLAGVAKAGGLITFLTTKFPMLGSAITLLSGPVGWIVAGIVALGTAFVIAYKNSETFRNVVNGALNGVKQTFITIGNIVKGFFQLFKGNGQDGVITLSKILPPNVVVGLTNFATKVKTIFMSIVTAVVNFAKSIGAQLQAFWAQNGVHIMAALNNIKAGFIAVWNVIKPIINAIWVAVKWTFTQILNVIKFMMPVITNILRGAWWLIQSLIVSAWNNIKGVISGALNVIMGVIKVFSGLFTLNFRLMWSGIKQIFFGALQFVWNLVQLWFVGKIFGVFKLGFSLIKGVVTRSLGGVKSAFTWSLSGIWNIVKSVFTNIWTFTKYIFTNIWAFTKSVWGNIRLAVTNPVGFINKVVPRTFRIMSNVIKAIFNGLKKSVTVIFSTMRTVVYNIVKALSNLLRGNFSGMRKNLQNITTALKNMVIKLWRILKDTVVNVAKALWNGVKGIFGNLFKSVKSTTQKLKDAVIARWKSIKTSVTDLATKAKNGVVNGFKAMYDKGVSWIDKLKKFLGDSISGFKKSAKNLGKGVANGAISGLNAMIDGINTLSDKIMKKKLIKKKIPKLSTGTGVKTDSNGLLKRGTRAVVNDRGPGNANGPNGHKELIYRRSGKIERPIGNNKKVNLRRGDGVINGAQSKSLLPHFAKGTGINWLDDASGAVKGAAEKGMHKASDGAKGLVEGGKNLAGNAKKAFDKTMGDVMDYVKNPMKLVDKTMKLFGVDFSGVKGAMGGMMNFGYKGLKKSIKDLVEGWFAEAEGGDGDSAWLLKHNILQTFGHYKGMTMNGTSRHWGVDFGMPTGTPIKALTAGKISQAGWVNGGGGNQVTLDEPGGKWFQWYMHMRNGGVKVKKGQKVKAGDLLGYSGSTGSSNTPHLHIQRMKGYPSNDTAVDPMSWLKSLKGGGGKSASKWKPEVIKALKMNGLPTTSSYVNAWIKQIDTESSGNAGAMGGTDGLADGRAQGLVQVKPGTFHANKFKGHGNIMKGLDNLLAGIRYAKGRYGANGMLNVIGKGHGYATGGLINSNGWYNLAEGGYPEFVIPTDPSKKTDAMKMLAIAANKIQGRGSSNKRPNQMRTPSNSGISHDSDILQTLVKMVAGQQEEISLLKQLVSSNQSIADNPVTLDGRALNKNNNEQQAINMATSLMGR